MPASRLSLLPRAAFLSALLAFVPGCASIQEALGLRVGLKDKPVRALEPSLAGAQRLCPGESAPLVVNAVLEGGQKLPSEGAGNGRVAWDSYRFQGSGARVNSEGVLTLTPEARELSTGTPALRIQSVDHPTVSAELAIPVRYDCRFVADFSGDSGRSGETGAFGQAGQDGKSEQSSGSSARAGGRGQDGGDGGNGGNGEAGRDADDVEVAVTLVQGEGGRPMLQVLARSLTRNVTRTFLVDTQGGALLVRANGGAGGNGGSGGHGGRGGGGGTGAPHGASGSGGNGGDGGDGADGGDGGRISVRIAPEAKPYQHLLAFESLGGAGGSGGNRGFGGSAGSVYSGARQGHTGQHGQREGRSGRPGRGGPTAEVRQEMVEVLW
jgi:hypothetical protein